MRYESYKKLREDFKKIRSESYLPKAIIVLNNNHKIEGYLLNVENNFVWILKLNGKIVKLSYTKIKKISLFDLPEKILRKISNRIII